MHTAFTTAPAQSNPCLKALNSADTLLSESWEIPTMSYESAAAPLYAAAAFGSAVRGTMTPDSDVDLFLVSATGTPEAVWAHQVNELASAVTA
jgi:UTP:GlnB (protein PII) uridylyltransferase